MDQGVAGRWFTHDRDKALWYIDNLHEGHGVLKTISLHRDVALVYRVDAMAGQDKNVADSPRAFSRDPASEYFLPPEVARRAMVTERLPTPLPPLPEFRPPELLQPGLNLDGKGGR